MDDRSIEGLLVAVAGQDRTAFRALYDRTSGKLLAIILRICRERSAAEDILQEVYVQIWRRAETFDPELGTGQAWLSILARRRAIDYIRSLGRVDRVATETELDMLETLPARASGAENLSDLRILMRCIGRLNPQHGKAILLAYYDGWSREDLARHFGTPDGTIKAWLRRGLMSLRTCMDGV
jgi:RNA polymerase sigma-70 factor (ECF subfamily)